MEKHPYPSFFATFAMHISAGSPRAEWNICVIYREDVYRRLAFAFQNFATFDHPEEQIATKTSS